MNDHRTTTASSAPVVALAIFMGVIAVLACGVPFVPPLVFVAAPLALISLALLIRILWRQTDRTLPRLVGAAVGLGLDLFALYLAVGHHHLIDWLEGH